MTCKYELRGEFTDLFFVLSLQTGVNPEELQAARKTKRKRKKKENEEQNSSIKICAKVCRPFIWFRSSLCGFVGSVNDQYSIFSMCRYDTNNQDSGFMWNSC